MVSLLLVLIYLSFISLGLPDSLLGSAWPSMYGQLKVPVSYAGIVSMIISSGTILSSINSGRLIRRLGTGLVMTLSVCMTALALFGFSISNSFLLLCIWAIPYGLGAGCVDSALNNFVALHYKSRHMNWLHCFWGIGATVGPYIMGYCLTNGLTWNRGYRTISLIQVALTALLVFSLPLWKKTTTEGNGTEVVHKSIKMKELLKMPGAKPVLTAFFCYCAVESTAGLWAGSYMAIGRGVSAEKAAGWAALFYLGITAGRFLSGFLSIRMRDKTMIRLGQGISLAGILVIALPLGEGGILAGLILAGLGCAPVFPGLLHETPENFGPELSQSIMGLQMACAYIGATLMPPLFGLISEYSGVECYPLFLFLFTFAMIGMVEKLNRTVRPKNPD